MDITNILLLVILGSAVGFFAGLLGIGGGAILVPALTVFFLSQHHDPAIVVHLALATSMSCIVINALLSIRTHHKHHAILWPIVSAISPAILLGSALATWLVIEMDSKTIALIFTLLMLLVALQLLIGFKPRATAAKRIPKTELLPVGFVIGFISAIIAIGGGSLTVPYLTWHQINIRKAIATAAAIGLPIALTSGVVFLMQGIHQTNLPELTFGYVFWPATLLISIGSLFTTSLGAHLTHRLPVHYLKKIFAAVIVILALKMYFSFT
ncbi:sulfite exporter TauE/SafE family protein [Marinicella litoralis]|uniref:Probable membrane transporter protein n=1 Tax=Marinicella litoralis TaxID=644220 RepID=A0A4R6XUU5_9GAMM|nr:sulfite exporter TauE/SafE family protein [Marinicella litoralis]TDR23782.1 putative membrane protein YfcA [Marinicella litoralis]